MMVLPLRCRRCLPTTDRRRPDRHRTSPPFLPGNVTNFLDTAIGFSLCVGTVNQTSRHSRNFSHTLSTKARSCTEVSRIHRHDASLARPCAILGQSILAMRGRLRRSMLSHGFMLGDVGFVGAPVDRMGRGPALLLPPSALVLPAVGLFPRQTGLCTAPVGSRLGAEDIRLRPESLWLGQSGFWLGEKGICLGHKYPFIGDKPINNRDLRFSASFCPPSRRPCAKSPIRPSSFP